MDFLLRLLGCSSDLIEVSAHWYCSANSFQWSLDRGTIVSGQGTSTIKVKPPLKGNFVANLEVGRTNGNSNYTESSSQTITRSARHPDFEIIYNEQTTPFPPDYICKTTGQVFAVANNEDISSVVWHVAEATVSEEMIENGKRMVTITPNLSIPNGNSITVYATVYYLGGCTIDTPAKHFKVYEAENPPIPDGSVYMEPVGGGVCDAQGYKVIFSGSNEYENGEIDISPSFLPPHAGTAPRPIRVCYINKCSGKTSCKTFMAYPPAPCNIKAVDKLMLTAYPNPTSGKINIQFDKEFIGSYTLYNAKGISVQRGNLDKNKHFQIDLDDQLDSGNYFLECIDQKGNKEITQIILSR